MRFDSQTIGIQGSRNNVTQRLTVCVDLRHPDAEVLDAMDRAFRHSVAQLCGKKGLEGRVEELWHMPVTRFAPPCVDAVREATEQLGYSHMEMVSGGGTILYTRRAKCRPA